MNGKIQLQTLRTPISNGALTDKLPTRLKLLDWGDNPSVKGPVRVTDTTVTALASNQAARGFAEVALDFEHNTVPGSEEFSRSQEPRKVAAYGVPKVIPGEGLFLESLRWTPTGTAEAMNYADLSPAVQMADDGTVMFVHSAALTRNGAVEGLSFFSVELNKGESPITMSEQIKNVITLSAMAAVLGLAATATEADVCEKLKTLSAPTVPAAPVDLKPLQDSLATLSATVTDLRSRLDASQGLVDGREKGTLIARFSVDGKVPKNADGKAYSEEELKALDITTLKILHANTPSTVPLNARGRKPVEGTGAGDVKGAARAAQEWSHLSK